MSIRLGPLHKILAYALAIALFATGLMWLVPHYLMTSGDRFGRHPLEVWALRLHGAAAMGFLVALGSMLPVHVRRAWQIRRNVRTGIAMLLGILILIITSYALYYASSEELRPWISVVHWTLGLTLVPFLYLHDRLGRHATVRKPQRNVDSRAHAKQQRGGAMRPLPVKSTEPTSR